MSEQEIRSHLSKNIFKLRKNKKMSQQQLGEALSYTDKAISKWETGETVPDIFTMRKLADYFNVTVDELISSDEIVKTSNKSPTRVRITLCATGLAVLCTIIAYFVLVLLQTLKVTNLPLNILNIFYPGAFFASGIVGIVFTAMWFSRRWLLVCITVVIWTGILVAMILMNFTLWWLLMIIGIIVNTIFYFFLRIIKN